MNREPASPARILIVDDDTLTAGVLQEYLQHHEFHVNLAGGCVEARAALAGPERVDLMILDYLMPDGHGTDLLRSLAEDASLQRPRILMCSSLIDPRNLFWNAICDRLPVEIRSLIIGYISKPYTLEELSAVVCSVLNVGDSAATNEILAGDYRPEPAGTSHEVETPAPSSVPAKNP